MKALKIINKKQKILKSQKSQKVKVHQKPKKT